jgi:hypothetical protein
VAPAAGAERAVTGGHVPSRGPQAVERALAAERLRITTNLLAIGLCPEAILAVITPPPARASAGGAAELLSALGGGGSGPAAAQQGGDAKGCGACELGAGAAAAAAIPAPHSAAGGSRQPGLSALGTFPSRRKDARGAELATPAAAAHAAGPAAHAGAARSSGGGGSQLQQTASGLLSLSFTSLAAAPKQGLAAALPAPLAAEPPVCAPCKGLALGPSPASPEPTLPRPLPPGPLLEQVRAPANLKNHLLHDPAHQGRMGRAEAGLARARRGPPATRLPEPLRPAPFPAAAQGRPQRICGQCGAALLVRRLGRHQPLRPALLWRPGQRACFYGCGPGGGARQCGGRARGRRVGPGVCRGGPVWRLRGGRRRCETGRA